MDLKSTGIFLHNPTAQTILQSEIEAGEYTFNGVLPFVADQVTSCDIQCATSCLPQVITITFADVDFGACNDCGKAVAFRMMLNRQSNFDIEDYLHMLSTLEVPYEPSNIPSGVVTAQTIRDWFVAFFDNGPYDDEHDFFGVVATAHPTNPADLVLTVPCPVKLSIFQAPDTEPITIVETDAGASAVLSKAQLQKEFPLIIGYVPGQAPDDTFTGCESICVIDIKGCIPACVADAQNLLTTMNVSHLHTAGTKFHYRLFVNSTAPGYAAFIAALNTAVTACTLIATVGTQLPAVQIVGTAATDTMDLSYFMGTTAGEFATSDGPISGTVSNGNVSINFNLTVPPLVAPITTAMLVADLNTKLGVAAFSVNGGDASLIDVTNAFSPLGAAVVIQFNQV